MWRKPWCGGRWFYFEGRRLCISYCGTDNIKGFGYCKKYQRECSPKLDEWTHSKRNKKIYNNNTHRYEYVVTRESTAICNGDTFAAFNSSGQTIPDYLDTKSDAIDSIEDEKKNGYVEKMERIFLDI